MKVTSADGIVISVVVEGAGPPMMLVSGTGDDQSRYGRVSPMLGKRFTLYGVDRRGRGESSDDFPQGFMDEAGDMLAVATLREVADERVIDLHRVDGEASQVLERR